MITITVSRLKKKCRECPYIDDCDYIEYEETETDLKKQDFSSVPLYDNTEDINRILNILNEIEIEEDDDSEDFYSYESDYEDPDSFYDYEDLDSFYDYEDDSNNPYEEE